MAQLNFHKARQAELETAKEEHGKPGSFARASSTRSSNLFQLCKNREGRSCKGKDHSDLFSGASLPAGDTFAIVVFGVSSVFHRSQESEVLRSQNRELKEAVQVTGLRWWCKNHSASTRGKNREIHEGLGRKGLFQRRLRNEFVRIMMQAIAQARSAIRRRLAGS